MSGRHVEDVLPRPAAHLFGEGCVQIDEEHGTAHPCQHGSPGWPCCHGGHGRHRAWPPAQPSTWLGAGIGELAARSSSQAGLATLRDVWSNDPDRTTRRGVLA